MSVREFYRLAPCSCGFLDERSWPYLPPDCACKGCGKLLQSVSFMESFRAYVPSTARKRFTPHFNTSLGIDIESPEHFAAMKEKFGAVECDLKPGAKCDSGIPDSVPRDWFAQVKHAQDTVARIEADAGIAAEAEADAKEFANDPVTEIDLEPVAAPQ